jgi:hypothetical protein
MISVRLSCTDTRTGETVVAMRKVHKRRAGSPSLVAVSGYY